MGGTTKCDWYIWSVKPDKLSLIKEYITSKVAEVEKVVCPSETKEKVLKSGEIRKKEVSIYGGYIFLKYSKDSQSNSIYYKLKSNPFIVSCIGSCSDKELISVYNISSVDDG